MILNHLNAGYPLLAVETFDDSAAMDQAKQAGRNVAIYSIANGVYSAPNAEPQAMNWTSAIAQAATVADTALVVRDVNHVLSNPPIYRALLDSLPALKANGSTVVMVAPNFGRLPPELLHVAPVIRLPMPSREELAAPLSVIAESAAIELNGNQPALLDAAAGLTLSEAENVFALALVETSALEAATVQREKMRTIAATGFLSVEQPRALSDIGGLQRFKDYLAAEVLPHCRDAQLMVRGVLLAGLPGTGKSLLSKAAGAALTWPIVRLDIGACKGSLVGQSESNIRTATSIIEALAPVVLWIDEIEKAVGGFRSSAQTDGGTTLGMLGHLLTWLQEHQKPIFTVATCNDYSALPPELTRAGRFDERFCVDLPSGSERQAIAEVHLRRLGCEFEPTLAETIARRTDQYTGAEIEQLVKSAARFANRKPTVAHIETASRSIKPVAVVNREAVEKFRTWAKGALRFANDNEPQAATGRKIKQSELN